MKETKFKHGDEVLVKGEYDEHDLSINKSWIDFEGGDGGWVNVDKIFLASEIERLDVWELAARVVALPEEDFKEVFGEYATILGVFRHNHPLDVKQKLDSYEQSKLQMGDLVEIECEGCVWRGIFVGDNGDDYYYILIPGYKCVQRFRQSTHIITKLEHGVIDILRTLDNIKELPEESEDKR